jgi:hypothetical protein
MDYYQKYLNYKTKYSELKKKLNNKQVGGLIVKTISNDGRRDDMSNQCFWISILDYLREKLGYSTLTLKELRTQAGLDSTTEHNVFDTDKKDSRGNLFFYNAAVNIAKIYGLNIQIFTADRRGNITDISAPRANIGSGTNLVQIAQYGLGHFELIDDAGEDFVPAVLVEGELRKIDKVEVKKRNFFLDLDDNLELIKYFQKELKKETNLKIELMTSPSVEKNKKLLVEKDIIIKNLSDKIKKATQKIAELREQLKKT